MLHPPDHLDGSPNPRGLPRRLVRRCLPFAAVALATAVLVISCTPGVSEPVVQALVTTATEAVAKSAANAYKQELQQLVPLLEELHESIHHLLSVIQS